MVLTYRQIDEIKFPCFRLPHDDWRRQDGLLMLDNKILDDTNIQRETLGARRAATPLQDRLYRLDYTIWDFPTLLKTNRNTFIDYRGLPFIYEKTKYCPLRYHKIKEVIKKGYGSFLVLDNCDKYFHIPRPPEPSIIFAGVLHFMGMPWRLYNYSEIRNKDTRRKI